MAYYKSFTGFLTNYENANAKDSIGCDKYKNVKLIDNEDKGGLK